MESCLTEGFQAVSQSTSESRNAWDTETVVRRSLYAVPERKVLQMTQRLINSRPKDSSSKMIFSDPVLCAQFLRGYVDVPMLKEVQPEDIENVTERYIHMFVEERDSDIVNRVHVKENDTPFFIVSLIEHKSVIDYNVVMQILRYMVFIWEDYEKEMERRQEGISRRKDFRYPPILPVIFYDGNDNWTAATELHERVMLSDIFWDYIPNYKCILVQLKDYSNAELLEKKDELSILLMIDKLKNAEDFSSLAKETEIGHVRDTLKNTPNYLLNIMIQVVEVFLEKLNVPQEEADTFTEQIKERRMGDFFQNFEGWDVQAIRKEAREEGIEKFLHGLEAAKVSKEMALRQLMEQYELGEAEAKEKMERYW